MDRLDCIRSFVRVVETGSFSAVARELNTTQPTVSKQIAALEDYLDVQLLNRSTRRMQLTQEGEQFLQHCHGLLDAAAEAEASVGQRQRPSGILRVSCPVAFGQHQVMPYVKGFLDRYPEIRLDLTLSDRFTDFVEENLDLAIRIGQVTDAALITQRLGTTRRVTLAAASYFHDHPEPTLPADLTQHNCIVYTRLSTGNLWQFQLPNGKTTQVSVSGNLQVDNSTAVRAAVLAGLGIAVCPVWLFGELIETEVLKVVLKEYQPPALPIYAVYRRGRFIPAKLRCFLDYFSDQFQRNPWVQNLEQ